MLATPAHLALIAAAVANGGVAMQPRLVASDPPRPLAEMMSPAVAERLAGMMRRVVTQGTGRGIETPGLAIAGKTGTAQNPHGPSHGWFIGFAPADRTGDALAVAVLVEHGGYGSQSAAPIARDLLCQAFGTCATAGEGT
jgi:peptidoglycan glycosyltransferase